MKAYLSPTSKFCDQRWISWARWFSGHGLAEAGSQKKLDRLILPGTQSQHQSSAAWLRMAGSALTWAVASSHYRCGVKSVWSSRQLPIFSQISASQWYTLRGSAYTERGWCSMFHYFVPLLPDAGRPRNSVAHNVLSLPARVRLRLVFILRVRIADSMKSEG